MEHFTYGYKLSNNKGYNLEFGVFEGNSIRRLADLTKDIIYGFDSFEGLPERWKWNKLDIKPAGHFSVDELPEVPRNVKLVKGWFFDTIPEWKEQHKDNIKFIHIDSDLYSSCITVLTELNNQIVPGTVIVFDELLKGNGSYVCWEEGEWKALKEWCEIFNREYLMLAKTYANQATIKITQ